MRLISFNRDEQQYEQQQKMVSFFSSSVIAIDIAKLLAIIEIGNSNEREREKKSRQRP